MLTRIPSLFFGVLYILMIPVFAAVFTSFAGEFYHSTVQFESDLKDDEQRVLTYLRNSMAASSERAYGTRALPDGPPSITWDHVGLYDLRYERGYFSFAFQVDPRGAPRSGPPTALRLRFTLHWPRVRKDNNSAKMYGIAAEAGSFGDMLRKLFPIDRRFSQEDQPPELGFIVLDDNLKRSLVAWSDGRAGFPAQSTGTYWRMLYLSTITITTVGYGDILPISTRARLWVGAEAVVGVVLIGLFLNALAAQVSRSGR